MNLTQTAAQNLAKQGVTFEGRSLIFKRAQELSPEKALKRMAKGRPVEAHVGEQKIPITQAADIVDLNFFAAQGSDEGLKDPELAHCLRDLQFESMSPYPMKAYRELSQPDTYISVRHPQLDYSAQSIGRDGVLALGFFQGLLQDPDKLAQPEKARSLKQLAEAGLLTLSSERPTRVYRERDGAIFVGGAFVRAEVLNDSKRVAETLEQLADINRLNEQYLPGQQGLKERLEKAAWKGEYDSQRCESLYQQFSNQEQGAQKLGQLLGLMPEERLPSQDQANQFEQMLVALPPGTPVGPSDFSWLTAPEGQFEQRLDVLKAAKQLNQHDKDWQRFSGEQMLTQLDNPQRLAFMEKLNGLAPLNREKFELACQLEPDQYGKFAYVYEEASRAGLGDLGAVWGDAGPSWSDTYQKLTADGLDAGRAVLAASALGDDPSVQMLKMASELDNADNHYSKNDYVGALKFASGLEADEQRDFAEIFSDQKLYGFEQSWKLTENYGHSDPGYREVLKTMKVCGLNHQRFSELKGSGASSATLLANLRETPDEKALRAQRWVAYTARQLSSSQAAVSGYSAGRSAEYQKQAQELRDMDHWYVPSRDYYQTQQSHRDQNKWAAQHGQSLSETARDWDRRMANLQSGQIPWGEPPNSRSW